MFSCTVFLSPLILLRHIVPETGVLPAAYGCFLYFITNARCLADPVFTKTHSVFLPKCRRTHRVFRHRRNFQIFSRKHLHFPPESVRITLADGGIAQLGEQVTSKATRNRNAASKKLISRKSSKIKGFRFHGGIAQLGERLNGIQEVSGSIPLISTNNRP